MTDHRIRPTSEPAFTPSAHAACGARYGERRCIKPLYRMNVTNEYVPHAGGHFFATEEQAALLDSGEYDAELILRALYAVPKEAITDA